MKAIAPLLALLSLAPLTLLRSADQEPGTASPFDTERQRVETDALEPIAEGQNPVVAEVRLTARHPAVIVRVAERAKEVLLQFVGDEEQALSEREMKHTFAILKDSVSYSSRELDQVRALHQQAPTPQTLVDVCETALEYTRASARLDAFRGGLYAVLPVDFERPPVVFQYPQVLAYHLRPLGHRSVVVLVDDSPFTAAGMANESYRQALDALPPTAQIAPSGE